MNGTLAVIEDAQMENELSGYLIHLFKSNPEVFSFCNIDLFELTGFAIILAQHKTVGPVEEAPVRNPYTGKVINYENWIPGYPNGNFQDRGEYWQTWVWTEIGGRFHHKTKTHPFCFVCEGMSSTKPVLRVRGLCKDSQFDRKFVISSHIKEVFFLQGDRHTNITYDRKQKMWVMISMRRIKEYETGGREPEATQPVRAWSKVGFKFIKNK